jgi:hypothetical protein
MMSKVNSLTPVAGDWLYSTDTAEPYAECVGWWAGSYVFSSFEDDECFVYSLGDLSRGVDGWFV